MNLGGRRSEKQRVTGHHARGVWGVRDYYTTLERLAEAGTRAKSGYVLLALTAALLATAGLLLNNSVVVIGSMCVAPFLGPSRAVCIGAALGDRKTLFKGLLVQLFGLLILGTGMALITTALLQATVPGIGITPEILLRAMPSTKDAVLTVLVAIMAGAAASLALTADPRIVDRPWGQIIDAMIGVEIAISLIPPASVVGIGLVLHRPDISRGALLLLAVNVLALDIIGSVPVLALRGVRSRWLGLEKALRRTAQATLAAVCGETLAATAIHVTLVSPAHAQLHLTVRLPTGQTLPPSLAQAIAADVREQTDCSSEVTVEMIPCQVYPPPDS